MIASVSFFQFMNRRDFLLTSTAAASLAQFALRPAMAGQPVVSELVLELIRANNAQVPSLLALPERGESHPSRGGVVNGHGIYTAGGTAGVISALVCAVTAPSSTYYKSPELVEPLRLAARYMLTAQHEDGTIDLYSTNFRSPPDTAFVIEVMAPVCVMLRASAQPALQPVTADVEKFILRAADALVVGGIHTPNHRWVVCAALAWANALFPDPRYVARIDQWLAETIDLDPDGQYTEKSTTVYSPVVDRALITVARLLQRPKLYDPVRKNLEMTLYYVHPDGEVVTEASRRQDRYQRGSMARYYYSYRTMALLDGNGRFAAMARQIEGASRVHLRGELAAFLTEPKLADDLPPSVPLPTDYEKIFAYSSLARIRRGDASGTILAGNTTLFSFRKRSAALEAVRFASAFFGKGQFVGDALEPLNGRYVLRQELDGPYFQPLSQAQIADGEHVRMTPNGTLAPDARALRERSNVQTLESIATIAEDQGKFTLTFSIRGTAQVPVAIELAFRHGGTLEGVEPVSGEKDAYLLRGDVGRYALGDDRIEFGPGRVEHTYTQIRGALPKWDGPCVYLTGFTPFEATVRIG